MDASAILSLPRSGDPQTRVYRIEHLNCIYWCLSQVLFHKIPGAVVELGCYDGRASVLMRHLMDHYASNASLHVYDSFQGLPPPGQLDTTLQAGDLAASPERLLQTYRHWQVEPPVIHEGWFDQTLADELPDAICFAHLDADYYDSTLVALAQVYPRLSSGAILLMDDYCDRTKSPQACDKYPGVKLAADEYFRDKPERPWVLVGSDNLSLAWLQKDA